MLEAGETMQRLEAAVLEARAFFGIDPLYEIHVRPETGGLAEIDQRHGYLFAIISVNLHYFQRNPEHIRGGMAHEVAHLVGEEVLAVQKSMPTEWQYGTEDARGAMLTHAIERMTVRLEKLFLRERPNPAP